YKHSIFSCFSRPNFLRFNTFFYSLAIVDRFIIHQIIVFMRSSFINIGIRLTFPFTLIMKLDSFQIMLLHFLHTDSCITHSFSTSLSRKFVMTNRRNFHVKYSTLYFIFIKCVLCEAVGSADQNHKTFKTFLFFTRKKKQKNLPSATSAKGGFALVARLKKTRDRSYFSKRCAEKSPP